MCGINYYNKLNENIVEVIYMVTKIFIKYKYLKEKELELTLTNSIPKYLPIDEKYETILDAYLIQKPFKPLSKERPTKLV